MNTLEIKFCYEGTSKRYGGEGRICLSFVLLYWVVFQSLNSETV